MSTYAQLHFSLPEGRSIRLSRETDGSLRFEVIGGSVLHEEITPEIASLIKPFIDLKAREETPDAPRTENK